MAQARLAWPWREAGKGASMRVLLIEKGGSCPIETFAGRPECRRPYFLGLRLSQKAGVTPLRSLWANSLKQQALSKKAAPLFARVPPSEIDYECVLISLSYSELLHAALTAAPGHVYFFNKRRNCVRDAREATLSRLLACLELLVGHLAAACGGS